MEGTDLKLTHQRNERTAEDVGPFDLLGILVLDEYVESAVYHGETYSPEQCVHDAIHQGRQQGPFVVFLIFVTVLATRPVDSDGTLGQILISRVFVGLLEETSVLGHLQQSSFAGSRPIRLGKGNAFGILHPLFLGPLFGHI